MRQTMMGISSRLTITINGSQIKDIWTGTQRTSGHVIQRNIENVVILKSRLSHRVPYMPRLKILIRFSVAWIPDGKSVIIPKSSNMQRILVNQIDFNLKNNSKKNLISLKKMKGNFRKTTIEYRLQMSGNNGLPITSSWTAILPLFGIVTLTLIPDAMKQ